MLRVVFAGTPEFALPTLQAIVRAGFPVVGVLTQPDRPAGRGRHVQQSPVKQLAQALSLPVAQPSSLRQEAGRAVLLEWAPDVMVVVAYGLLLPPAVLSLPRFGCINVHASLLPRWRGAAPIQRAILAGDTHTGISIMQMDVGLDTGPVLAQSSIVIAPQMDAQQLHDALAEQGAGLLVDTLRKVAAGSIQARAQPAEATYAYKLDKSEARIDWRHSAESIARQVRAFNPWPVAETRWHGAQLRIWQAQVVSHPLPPALAPGTVLGMESQRWLVACGEGVLGIERLQPAGKRVMSARDFASGQPNDGVGGACG